MKYDTTDIIQQTESKIYLKKLIKQGKKIELKAIHNKRSNPLNAYLHVCITMYAIEFGYTLEEAKTYLKRMCSFMVYEKNDTKFLRKTSSLDNLECSEFVNWIRTYAGTHGLNIPTAEEYKQNSFAIDREISKYKEYL